jgi:glycosyltransferase involved in cell wall biosynthesis
MGQELDMSMKKVLSISYAMPPILYPRSIQVQRILLHLIDFGWKSSVISVEPDSVSKKIPRDKTLEELSANRLEIIRIPSIENLFFYRAFLKLFPFFRKLPDPSIIWAIRAKETAIKILSLKKFDVLITWGQPMSDHIAGLQIKKKTEIKWIAHFSDPWIDNPYINLGYVTYKINQCMERNVILNADTVIFTSDATKYTVMKKYSPKIRDKAFVIPHAFDPKLFSEFCNTSRDKPLTISHIGNLYGFRGFDEVLKALVMLRGKEPFLFDEVSIKIIGTVNSDIKDKTARLSLNEKVLFTPPIPYLDSLQEMENSDVLLIVESKYDRGLFLPSKLIDYLGSNRPLLGIVNPNSTSAKIINDAGGIVADINNVEDIYRSIVELIHAKKQNRMEKYYPNDIIRRQFESKRIAALWDNIVFSHPLKNPKH